MDYYELLWFLLPFAAWSGWVAARRSFSSQAETHAKRLSTDYLRGLDYLLNEQPDKAIDVFIRLIDVDKDTVETHLALGALFRRRGEVNRAIRIHQNLIKISRLNPQQKALATLELGLDYQRAGLLDRAEDLFQELVQFQSYRVLAYRQLLDIYQQEQDWEKAIRTAWELSQHSGENLNAIIAQYHCEQAEAFQRRGNFEQIYQILETVLNIDPQCVRASLTKGYLMLSQPENTPTAIKTFQWVEQQNPLFISEIIDPLETCYRRLNKLEEFTVYLQHILQHYGGISPLLALAQRIREQTDEQQAATFIIQQLKETPSLKGLAHFIDLTLNQCEENARPHLLLVKEILMKLLKNYPLYRCKECGFSGRTLHWQCPSCKQWNTIAPLQN
ncbi:MAG: lipopolysaccharide assembly protein LapB [Pseudomonadota bacterium]|jgi:lipopolysaccharide biosynthesis regulator YciM